MKFLVEHPTVKWVTVVVGIISFLFTLAQYGWHLDNKREARLQRVWIEKDEKWFEQDQVWNSGILAALSRIEARCFSEVE